MKRRRHMYLALLMLLALLFGGDALAAGYHTMLSQNDGAGTIDGIDYNDAITGEWPGASAREALRLDSIVLTDDLRAEKLLRNDLLPVHGGYTLDLNGLRVVWLDQNGDEWLGEKSPVWNVSPPDGATVDGDAATLTKAGSYEITLSSGGVTSGALDFTLVADRLAATPEISNQTDARTYQQYDEVDEGNCLSVTASAADGGVLTCQWYESATGDPETFSPISGACGNTYAPSTERQGDKWFRCVVTNTIIIDLLDGRSLERYATCAAADIKVSVGAPSFDLLLGVGESYDTGLGEDGTVSDPSVARATGGVIVGLSPGETNVTFPSSGSLYSVKVVYAPTQLILPADSLTLNPGESVMLSCAVAPAGTRKNPIYTSSDPSIATVDVASGLVTGVAVGKITITAKSYNDTDGAPIRDTCAVTVTDLDRTAHYIDAAGSVALPKGDTVAISDLINAGAISVKVRNAAGEALPNTAAQLVWSTGDTGISINGGTLEALIENTSSNPYNIVASYGALNSASLPVLVTPARALKAIGLEDERGLLDGALIESGKTLTRDLNNLSLVPTDQYGGLFNTQVTWRVDQSGASISGSTLTVSAAGTYSITAQAQGIASNSLSFSVYPDAAAEEPIITKQPVSPVRAGQYSSGEPLTVEASVSDGGALSYQWYQIDGSLAAPIAGGTGASYTPPTDIAGATTYRCAVKNTLTLPEGSERYAQTQTSDIVVIIFRTFTYPDDITLSVSELTLKPGQTYQIVYWLTPGSVGSVRFTSDNANVAAVNDAGFITAVSEGTATITATTNNWKEASLTVNVISSGPDADHIVTSGTVTIAKGDTINLTSLIQSGGLYVMVCDKNGAELPQATVSWASSDEGLRIVDDNLTALARPSAPQDYYTITARYKTLVSDPIKVYVTPAQPQGGIKMGVNEKLDLSGAVGVPAKYSTSDKKIATVSKLGVVKAKKAGKAVITAKTIPAPNAGSVTIQYAINVLKSPRKIALSAATASLEVGDTFTLTYKLPDKTAGKVTAIVKNPLVADIDADGRVTALAPGVTKIVFKAYNGIKASCKVTVKPKGQGGSKLTSLTVEPSNATLGVGEKITPICRWEPAGAECVPKRSVSSTNVQLAGKGAIKGVKAGTAVVTYTAGGLQARVNVTVLKKPKSLKLDIEAVSLSAGETRQLTPLFAKGQGGSVTYESGDEKVATVSKAGLVTARAPGKATITATTYNGKMASCAVSVGG